MTDRELLQMALDWADNHGEVVFAGGGWNAVNPMNEWTRPLRARLAQPDRNFQFSTIEEAMQPMHPMPAGQPQLTDDETKFANAFTTLIKAGYGKEAEIVLKCKREWVGLTEEEMLEAENGCSYMDAFELTLYAQKIEAKLKEKNGG